MDGVNEMKICVISFLKDKRYISYIFKKSLNKDYVTVWKIREFFLKSLLFL